MLGARGGARYPARARDRGRPVAIDLLNPLLAKTITRGTLTVLTPDGAAHVHGSGEPAVTVRLHDPRLLATIPLGPELRAGEAYMDGTLTVEAGGVRGLLALFGMNRSTIRQQPAQRTVKRAVKRLRRFQQANPIARSRENVAHHYDLSNDLYRLFLDEETMAYSCGYWPGGEGSTSLREAQEAKHAHIAQKLNLRAGQRVLDVGCGWGGMAIHLARHHDVEVVGVTLSREQKALADERVAGAGLQDRIEVRLQDYRDVPERFDRVVSIGMFEHVGVPQYDAFFAKVLSVLPDDGCALIHSIGRKGGPSATDAWTRKYVFPGGYSPALSETLASAERVGAWVTDVEVWRLHYAYTIKQWWDRFQANRDRAEALFDARFCRMWEFYLAAAEASFRHGKHVNFQLQLAPTRDALPISRDYMLGGR